MHDFSLFCSHTPPESFDRRIDRVLMLSDRIFDAGRATVCRSRRRRGEKRRRRCNAPPPPPPLAGGAEVGKNPPPSVVGRQFLSWEGTTHKGCICIKLTNFCLCDFSFFGALNLTILTLILISDCRRIILRFGDPYMYL